MSWALRAHVRNLVLRASLGSSFSAVDELKQAKCTLDICPCPVFRENEHFPPPTDDEHFLLKRLGAAKEIVLHSFVWSGGPQRLSKRQEAALDACLKHAKIVPLLSDLFWYFYLSFFGRRYASKSKEGRRAKEKESYRTILSSVFCEADADGSKHIDAQEFSNLLKRLGVDMPPACCADLIQMVDVNGDGALDEDEFLEMMCLEMITDKSIDEVEEAIAMLRRRIAQLFCTILSPFTFNLPTRDAIAPYFCQVLATTIYTSFPLCFVSYVGDLDERFEKNIQESVMEWFTGTRNPFKEKKANPVRKVRNPGWAISSLAASLRNSPFSPSPQLPFAVLGNEKEELTEYDELRAELLHIRRRLPDASPVNMFRLSSLGSDDSSAQRQAQHRTAEMARNTHYPGRPKPPIPTINLQGCTTVFNECFNTPRPNRPLHTLMEQHITWGYTPGQFSQEAERCISAHPPPPVAPATARPTFFRRRDSTDGPTRIREVAQEGRRMFLEKEEERRGEAIAATAVLAAMQKSFVSVMAAVPRIADVEESAEKVETLYAECSSLLAGNNFKHLDKAQRRLLLEMMGKVSSKRAKLKREIAFKRITSKMDGEPQN